MLKTLKDADFSNKKVVLRVDYNVPIENGVVQNTKRIDSTLPTIKYLVERGCKIILISHLGRPKGRDSKYSLLPVKKVLEEKLNKKISFFDELNDGIIEKIDQMKEGDIGLLENIRFYPEEENNDESFSKKLAGMGDIFVSDAFASLHRKHSSTVGIARFLPSYAGFLVEKEVNEINSILNNKEHPFTLVLGGAKVSDKIKILNNLAPKVDNILIGGAMANNFIAANGYNVGCSKIDSKEMAENILSKMSEKIKIPVDAVVADQKELKNIRIADIKNIKDNEGIYDIGPRTISYFSEVIKKSRMLVMNGPLGMIENPNFKKGTKDIISYIGQANGIKIAGGGETITAIEEMNLEKNFTYISTGGGAFLEMLEGKTLPGIEVLLK
ncbi:MAG: phosphoglycerate kinase [Thermoplasmata archaeon]